MKGTEKKFDNFYLVDIVARPDDIDHEWADAVVEEWMLIYKRFLDESENFISKVGKEKVEIILGHHPNILRRFIIRFI